MQKKSDLANCLDIPEGLHPRLRAIHILLKSEEKYVDELQKILSYDTALRKDKLILSESIDKIFGIYHKLSDSPFLLASNREAYIE